MRKFIFTIMLLLAGYVGYMYFFGQGEDKVKAEMIVNETKDLGKAVGDFLGSQKEKYDEGEFDNLIDKVGAMLNKLKSGSEETQKEVQDNLKKLQKELKQIDPDKLNEENKEALEKVIKEVEEELDE
jgi:uncharacterized protein YaaN involved in tellurite resistance